MLNALLKNIYVILAPRVFLKTYSVMATEIVGMLRMNFAVKPVSRIYTVMCQPSIAIESVQKNALMGFPEDYPCNEGLQLLYLN